MSTEERKPRLKDMVIFCVKCDTKLQLEANQEEVQCPQCGSWWSVRWLAPDLPLPQRRIMSKKISNTSSKGLSKGTDGEGVLYV